MSNSEPSNTDLSQPEFSTRFLGAAPTKSPLTTPSEAAAEVRSPSTGGSDKDDTVNGYRHGTRPVTNPALKTNRDNFERYRLLEKLGQGGMGSVWKAQQIEPVKRDVAIKMINAAIANEDTRKRFFAERQTLARMGHPEIANILDGGTTPDGQPYLVMELAEGLPLDEFCQKHRLSIRARVELIERIARALSHAHERGIVHRDLKPTNILVSGTPDSAQFKIIDFGIAKVVEGACDTTDTATVAGQILGTPHFMSPEQANLNEQRIDVRSDVYALGVILYQLLTDATPLEACGIDCEASLPELLRCVVEEDAPRPSAYLRNTSDRNSLAADRSTSRKHLIRAISGDLDWLILKTLAKAADERYQSATSLADDIDRFLNFEPINAQRPTLRYRLNRWLHRKRSIVMLSALFSSALCLVLAIAFGVWRFNVGVAERRTEEIRQQVLTLVDDAELHLLSASELNRLRQANASIPIESLMSIC
ncbi:MAG: serine/threonine-protein kinase [Pirellulaceae bacterium]